MCSQRYWEERLNHRLKPHRQRMINAPISCGTLDHSNPPAVPPSHHTACFGLSNTEAAYQSSTFLAELSENPRAAPTLLLLGGFSRTQTEWKVWESPPPPIPLPAKERNISKAIID